MARAPPLWLGLIGLNIPKHITWLWKGKSICCVERPVWSSHEDIWTDDYSCSVNAWVASLPRLPSSSHGLVTFGQLPVQEEKMHVFLSEILCSDSNWLQWYLLVTAGKADSCRPCCCSQKATLVETLDEYIKYFY